jgi:hypothetical protein
MYYVLEALRLCPLAACTAGAVWPRQQQPHLIITSHPSLSSWLGNCTVRRHKSKYIHTRYHGCKVRCALLDGKPSVRRKAAISRPLSVVAVQVADDTVLCRYTRLARCLVVRGNVNEVQAFHRGARQDRLLHIAGRALWRFHSAATSALVPQTTSSSV